MAFYPCILDEPSVEFLDMLQNMYHNPEGYTGGGDYQIQNPSSIANTNIEKQLGIYPNPANSQITITVDKQKIETLMVYDMQGKLLISQTPNTTNMYQLPIAQLPEGIYSIVVKTNKTVYTQKITVIHP